MVKLLTTRELQAMLQVDRTTIYRMVEAKRLPAIKVGNQWRFPADQVKSWLQQQTHGSPDSLSFERTDKAPDSGLFLPADHIRIVQDAFAKALGIMIVVTDMNGNPLAGISNPCGLLNIISQTPNAISKCIDNWSHLDAVSGLGPQFIKSRLGLLGARGLIRVRTELKGMVIAGGIAPGDWPPDPAEVTETAAFFGLPPKALLSHIHEVFYLDEAQKALVLSLIQRIADILAHAAADRLALTEKLDSIAKIAVTAR